MTVNDDRDRNAHDPRARLGAVLAVIMEQPPGPLPSMMCDAAAQHLHAPGVGVTVAVSDHLLRSAQVTGLGSTGDRLQEELGDGPAYAAHRSGRAVLASDLARDVRWPAFASAALEDGIRASFAFPVGSGAVRLGTLNLYRSAAVPLDDEQHADALVFARLALDVFGAPREFDGQIAAWLRDSATGATGFNPQLHQATGMVSAQLGIGITDALAALRAHAYAADRRLSDVVADVVARTLRLDENR